MTSIHKQEPEVFPDGLKTSIVHPRIDINGDSGLLAFPNKTGGSGTSWADAIYIENLEIDGGAAAQAIIRIVDTSLFLVIRNCTLSNGVNQGIDLDNCTNINVTGCEISSGTGIRLTSSSNNIISGNNVSGGVGGGGIELSFSDFNDISGNNVTATGIPSNGIMYSESDNNTVSGNNVSGEIAIHANMGSDNNITENNIKSIKYCINLESSSNNNIVSKNNLTNASEIGIYLAGSNFNTISENVVANKTERGMYLEAANNNTIIRNICSENDQHCIRLSTTEGNEIFLNDFYGNATNISVGFADDSSVGNSWDNGTFGNYYGDYSTKYPSASNDGLVWNESYQIPGGASMQDNYPMVSPYNLAPLPSANFTINTTGLVIQNDWVQFNFTGAGSNFPISFEWDFGDSSSNSTDRDPVHQYTSTGNYTVTIKVTDVDGDSDTKVDVDLIEVVPDLQPVSSFYANMSLIIVGDSVQFTFNGGIGNGNENYQWNFTDSTPIDPTQNPVHTFNTDGSYTPILTVTDIDGDSSNSSSGVQIIVLIGVQDEDGDGLSNYDEVKTHGTSPFSKDTDGDGYNDNIEIAEGTDPTNKDSHPSEDSNFWDQLLQQGLLIPIVGGIVGLVFTVMGIIIKRRMSKGKRDGK
ncbi:MAG: NosD domain-containing protein [Candidatus Hodarchaeota archaeon]